MNGLSGLALAVDTPSRMTIVNPFTYDPVLDADGEPAWIDVLSLDSAAAAASRRAAQNRRLKSRNRTLTAEELDADAVDLLVAITAGWRLLTLDGAPADAPFSKAAARQVYADGAFAWLRGQVEMFAADLGNFRGRTTPATSSPSAGTSSA